MAPLHPSSCNLVPGAVSMISDYLPLQWGFPSGSQYGVHGLSGTFLPGKLHSALTLVH